MTLGIVYKPIDADTIANPFVVFEELRTKAPILWHDVMKSWVVSSFAECKEVLLNHAAFARDPRRVGLNAPEARRNIQTEDPPEQFELRKLMMRALHNQDIDGVCARARVRFQQSVLEQSGGGPFNLMSLAGPAAMDVINEIIGCVHYDAANYYPIFRDLTRVMDAGLDPSRIDAGRAAGVALSDAVRTWFTAGDGVGMIAELGNDKVIRGMPAHYVHNTLGGVFNAGYSTLYASIGSLGLLLLQRPDVLDELRDERRLVTGVDELLRYTSPAQATSRFAVERTTLGGTSIEAGSMVVVLMAAANRDPNVFEDPNQVRVDRNPNPHLAFAWGPHVCLGAQLARAWAAEIVRLFQETRGVLKLVGEATYMDTATLRNITKLQVEVK